MLDDEKVRLLREGLVIPAHPLALHGDRTLDEERQRGLTRYYLDSGADGVAVGVHTTQFEIHGTGLYPRVLDLAAQECGARGVTRDGNPPLLVAGVMGPTGQAVAEAEIARDLGYDMALVPTNGWGEAPEEEILEGLAEVSNILPVFGFYLQEAIGRRRLGYEFWAAVASLRGVAAIKIAPFDRYATLDVIRAVADAGRVDDIALYTGNDDNIVVDLLTPFPAGDRTVHIVGGLLGQFSVWTPAAVGLHRRCRALVRAGGPVPLELLTEGARLTDANGAVFDVAHRFAGSIAGVGEVLRREGLVSVNTCLADREVLSPGQAAELDRVTAAHPQVVGAAVARS